MSPNDKSFVDQDASTLRAVLDADLAITGQRPGRPMLLGLTGLPGTGKTFFARSLTERTPFVVLETDRLRKVLVPQPRYTPGEHSRVFSACYLLIQEYLGRGYPVLFDATNLSEGHRDYLYEIAGSMKLPVALVLVTAPRDLVRSRLRDREAGLDPNTNSDAGWLIYTRLATAWEEVQRDHFRADTSQDITPVLDQVVGWVEAGGAARLNPRWNATPRRNR